MVKILGVESSCDDSSAAIVEDGLTIRANVIASQEAYHRKYGGVVPEIAARKHLEHMLPVIDHCFEKASMTMTDIDAIAVTHRPGLVGSLVVGLTVAKTLAVLYRKPLIGIHHIEAHAYAACLAGLSYGTPHVSLVASGGHTSLLHMGPHGSMTLIGQSVDDAAGEAFDKVSKLLGFGYPGGPVIDRLAKNCRNTDLEFPRPMLTSQDFNFSFSGLKTAVMYHRKSHPETSAEHIATAFQKAVVDVLVTKTLFAAQTLKLKTISVVGGVAANSELRDTFLSRCKESGIHVFIPPPTLCTDNAAMVAGLGFQKFIQNSTNPMTLGVNSHSGMILGQ